MNRKNFLRTLAEAIGYAACLWFILQVFLAEGGKFAEFRGKIPLLAAVGGVGFLLLKALIGKPEPCRPWTEWNVWYWILFVLLDGVITFQLSAEFVFFADIWQRNVTAAQGAAFFVSGVLYAFPLLGLCSLFCRVDRWRKKERKKRSVSHAARWIGTLAAAVLVFVGAARLAWDYAPHVIDVAFRKSELTIRHSGEGYVYIFTDCYVNGAATKLPVTEKTGDWQENSEALCSLEPGAALKLEFEAAEDIDLHMAKGADAGAVEIRDGEETAFVDLSTPTAADAREVYTVKSNAVQNISADKRVFVSALVGVVYAAVCLLFLRACRTGKRFRTAVFLSVLSVWCLYLAAVFPGALPIDGWRQLNQALGLETLSDAHPALTTMFYRLLLRLTGNRFWVLTAWNMVTFALVVAVFADYLAKHGLSRWMTGGVSIAFAAHIVNGIYATVLWKDVPYTICLLWATLLLVRVAVEGKHFFRSGNIGKLGVCMALLYLLRHNGIVPLGLMLAAMLILVFTLRTIRPLFSAALAVALLLVIRGPIYGSLDIEAKEPFDSAEFLHGIMYADILSGDDDPFLYEVAPKEVWQGLYDPYCANSITFTDTAAQTGVLDFYHRLTAKETLTAYGKTFLRHPFYIIKDRLYGCTLLWNMMPAGYNFRAANDTYEFVTSANDFGMYCRENFLTDFIADVYVFTAGHVVTEMLIWRAGPYIALTLVLLFLGIVRKKRGIRLIMLPIAGNSLSLGMAMAWQDYRYVYFAMVCCVFLTLSWFILPEEEENATHE